MDFGEFPEFKQEGEQLRQTFADSSVKHGQWTELLKSLSTRIKHILGVRAKSATPTFVFLTVYEIEQRLQYWYSDEPSIFEHGWPSAQRLKVLSLVLRRLLTNGEIIDNGAEEMHKRAYSIMPKPVEVNREIYQRFQNYQSERCEKILNGMLEAARTAAQQGLMVIHVMSLETDEFTLPKGIDNYRRNAARNVTLTYSTETSTIVQRKVQERAIQSTLAFYTTEPNVEQERVPQAPPPQPSPSSNAAQAQDSSDELWRMERFDYDTQIIGLSENRVWLESMLTQSSEILKNVAPTLSHRFFSITVSLQGLPAHVTQVCRRLGWHPYVDLDSQTLIAQLTPLQQRMHLMAAPVMTQAPPLLARPKTTMFVPQAMTASSSSPPQTSGSGGGGGGGGDSNNSSKIEKKNIKI